MAATNVESLTNPRDSLPNSYQASIAAREIDFVSRFGQNWDALRAILGVMRPIRKAPGTTLSSVKASVALEDGSVDAGEVIPYSKTSFTKVAFEDLTIEKYAKAVTIEEVNKYGADVAIEKSDEAFRNQLQTKVMTDFFTFLNTGTGATTGTADTWQKALALAKASVLDVFQRARITATEVVGFANIMDAYEYLGEANITIQTAFGINYVQNFLGYSTLFLLSDPDIAEGTVIALPIENIDLYYIDPSDSEFARLGLDYTVQGETNLIGFHAQGAYHTAVGETYALMGMKLWAEYANGIAIITFGDDAVNPSVTLSQKTMTLAEGGSKALTATTVPADAEVTWASSDDTKVTVSNGTVTAVAEGSANVTATITVDGTQYTATCAVTVTAA